MDLTQKRCVPCEEGAPTVSPEAESDLLATLPDWQIIEVNGTRMLEREYRFPDFLSGMTFATQVGHTAEEENHHPEILLQWGRVRVRWWSHKIRGLHENDFVMAARTDSIHSQI